MDANRSVHKMLDKISNSNGIVWSSDAKTMYFIDTPTFQVAAFEYDTKTGEVSNRRVAVDAPGKVGYPDGLAIDAENKLWGGHWDG